MPLGLTIGQPPPNGVVVIGETTLVSGTATGTGGAEPVLVDSVTIRIGGGPIVAAGLSHVGLARNFKAEVVVPGPPGPVAVTVTAHFDGNRVLTKTVTAIATEGALTGCWLSDDGMLFFLNQNGNTLWWVGLDGVSGRREPSDDHEARGDSDRRAAGRHTAGRPRHPGRVGRRPARDAATERNPDP
jgi:hypothetical protein